MDAEARKTLRRAVALLALATAAGSAQEATVIDAAGQVQLAARTLDIKPGAAQDEFEVFVENLHLRLPDRDLELRADHAVLWGDKDLLRLLQGGGDGGGSREPLRAGPTIPPTPDRPPLRPAAAQDPAAILQSGLKEIYAEGHVFFRDGDDRVVFADRFYQHLLERRGIVVDCDLLAQTEYRRGANRLRPDEPAPPRLIDLRLRASELRVLGPDRVAAADAQFTTCRYGAPHYHVNAGALTARVEDDPELGPSPVVEAKEASFRWDDVPLAPLPSFAARLDEGDSLPLKRVRAGHSNRFGAFLQTLWGAELPDESRALTETFATQRPFKLGWEADVDAYSRRGVGVGPALDWREAGRVEGELGGYWLRDRANSDQETPFTIDQPDRGRAWFRDRYTPDPRWRLDTEVQWLSDAGFQPEFFEREFKEEKEPENYAHLTRQEDNTRFSILYRNRLNDFQSQTDALPGAGFEQIGEPLLKLPLPGLFERDGQPNYLVLSHFTELGNFRDHPADGLGLASERVVRGDSELELSTTLPVGPASIRPFTAGRFTGWDRNSIDDANVGRAAGIAGARGEIEVHRNFDAWVPWLGIDGLRHVAMLEVDYVNVYDVSRTPSQLIPIDSTEQLDRREVYLVGVHQRLQTHRGREVVNVFDFDVELPLYPNARRDNPVSTPTGIDGRTEGPLHFELRHHPDFSAPWLKNTSLFAEGDYDFHDDDLKAVDFGALLEPAPDWTTVASWRTTRGISRVLTGEIDYRLTEKWAVAALEQYDFLQGRGLEHRLELRRLGHDFTFAIGFQRDSGDGNTSLSFAIYPSILGSRGQRSFAGGRGEQPGLDPNSF